MHGTAEYGNRLAGLDEGELQACGFRHPDLRIARHLASDGKKLIDVYWGPFDALSRTARVAIFGLTPGFEQMATALRDYRGHRLLGMSHGDSMAEAARNALFAGATRRTLVSCLDEISLHRALGIPSVEAFWTQHADLVHFSSALRWPVFINSRNYNGTSPPFLKQAQLLDMVEKNLTEEIDALPGDSLIIPLGLAATDAVIHVIRKRKDFRRSRLLLGIPHPGGAGRDISSQFLGLPARGDRIRPLNPRYRELALSLRADVLNWARGL